VRVGFYDPFLAALGGGERYCLTLLAEAVQTGHEVELLSPRPPDPGEWSRRLGIHIDPEAFTWTRAGDPELLEASRRLDLLVAMANDVPPRNEARRAVAVVQFPLVARDRPLARARARALRALRLARAPAALASYDTFVCYSRFAAEHTRRRLGVQAEVVPPPVEAPDPGSQGPGPESRSIAAVGRFFTGAHAKKQEVLIEALARLRRILPAGEAWELHLAGGAAAGARDYLDRLRRAARGLPVRFHVDAPAAEVERLLWRSPLFWHAAGQGEDPDRHPERLEHFGIATVEAMLHRAVPLVVPAGGQVEIVQDGVTGVFWRRPEELAERTAELVAEPARRRELAAAAARSAASRFGLERFLATAREVILRGP
jgi:glycosyltransferase involved in cell wall biosynthesis